MSFFTTLNYSSCNKDGLTELRALDVSPGYTVCCITGSGDRVFHFLLGNSEYGFSQFLGLHPSPKSRWEDYLPLRLQLTPDAARWFDARRNMIERGILYDGAVFSMDILLPGSMAASVCQSIMYAMWVGASCSFWVPILIYLIAKADL